jgi:hypothetical protein
MAILYGTQSNGETLPVLVDQFGNLSAKGIEGPPGPPGPEGPPGPPGSIDLPPDPYEGAVLGWQDGELAWLGGSVVLPAGTYGPLVYSFIDGTLIVPQNVSSLVAGQQLYMSDDKGTQAIADIKTSKITNVTNNVLSFVDNADFEFLNVGLEVQPGVSIENISAESTPPTIQVSGGSWYGSDGSGNAGNPGWYYPREQWSDYGGDDPSISPDYSWSNAFNAVLSSDSGTANSFQCKSARYDFPALMSGSLDFFASTGSTYPEGTTQINVYNSADQLINVFDAHKPRSEAGWIGAQVTSEAKYFLLAAGQTNIRLQGVRLNNKLLVDSSVPDGKGQEFIELQLSGSGSVLAGNGNTIIMRSDNKQWANDYYVTAPEQKIAARNKINAIKKDTKRDQLR